MFLRWQTRLLDFGQCQWLAWAGNGPIPIIQFARHLPWASRVIGLWPMLLAGLGWRWPHSNNPVCCVIYIGQTGSLDFGQCPWLALAGDGPAPITQFAAHLPWADRLLDFGQCPWLAMAGNHPIPITQFARHSHWANQVIGLLPMPLADFGWRWPRSNNPVYCAFTLGKLDFGQCPWLAMAGNAPIPITQFGRQLRWANRVIGFWPVPLAGPGSKWSHFNNPVCLAFTLGKPGYWTLANALGWPWLEMAPFQ